MGTHLRSPGLHLGETGVRGRIQCGVSRPSSAAKAGLASSSCVAAKLKNRVMTDPIPDVLLL